MTPTWGWEPLFPPRPIPRTHLSPRKPQQGPWDTSDIQATMKQTLTRLPPASPSSVGIPSFPDPLPRGYELQRTAGAGEQPASLSTPCTAVDPRVSESSAGPALARQQHHCPGLPLPTPGSTPELGVSPPGSSSQLWETARGLQGGKTRAGPFLGSSRTPGWQTEPVAGLREGSTQQASKARFEALQTIPAAFGLFSGIPV